MIFLVEPKKYYTSKEIRYLFRNSNCLGCTCFSPGERKKIVHPITRGMRKSDPPASKLIRTVCTTQYDNDNKCPVEVEYDEEVKKERFAAGWKTAII